ncbi:MAG: transglutaminase domain-containing protein, partial [Armatimonadetes bacterium]|nr:transglutaminase domain-containing protein [Anaerolineae bacterium]
MTTSTNLRPSPAQRPPAAPSLVRRLLTAWRGLFAPGDWTTLAIVLALILMPVLALQTAQWPIDARVMIPTALLSVVFGFLLARSRYSEFVALFFSITYGGLCVLLLAAANTPGSTYAVLARAVTWGYDALTGGINTDELVFTLLVALLFWFLGYNAAWHVFRIDRVWRVILPPGLVLMTNAVFYIQPEVLQPHMAAFVFLALLLIARSHLDAREWEWYANGIRIPPRLRVQFLRVGAGLALIVLALAWIAPTGNLQQQLDNFQEFLRSEPLTEMNELFNRLFASIESDGATSADYYGGDSLLLSGAISLGDTEVFYADAPTDYRYYWRSRVFDTYERGRWTPGAEFRLTTDGVPFVATVANDAARTQVEQRFTLALRSSRLVYTAPQPWIIGLETKTDLLYTAPEGDPSRAMNISAVRPIRPLERGNQYITTSLLSVATADQLRAAGTEYPAWILSHPQYLRATPNVLSQETLLLAQQIVSEAGATTPYDQAKAIEGWLRVNITYDERIPTPPSNIDPVDWLLFDESQGRRGYCNYYATAMVVMLRGLGIPARMAAGFSEGTYDPAQAAYVVRERDAHTWVEAYFPGYGWIEFEPTSAQAPLQREGDKEAAQ